MKRKDGSLSIHSKWSKAIENTLAMGTMLGIKPNSEAKPN